MNNECFWYYLGVRIVFFGDSSPDRDDSLNDPEGVLKSSLLSLDNQMVLMGKSLPKHSYRH